MATAITFRQATVAEVQRVQAPATRRTCDQGPRIAAAARGGGAQ